MQSVPINTNVVSSNTTQVGVYFIPDYVITFVSDLRQVCGFHLGTSVSSTYKTDCHKILLKVVLNTIKPNQSKLMFIMSCINRRLTRV